jgi:hypothetical protein
MKIIKKKEVSTFTDDQKIANELCKIYYFKVHEKGMKMFQYFQKKKQRF